MATVRTGSFSMRTGSSSPPVSSRWSSATGTPLKVQQNVPRRKGIFFTPSAGPPLEGDVLSIAKLAGPPARKHSFVIADSAGVSRSPPPCRMRLTGGSLSAPTSNEDRDGCSLLASSKTSPRMSAKTSMMTSSTEDGLSVASVHDLVQIQLDARLKEQEEKFEAMFADMRREFAEKGLQRDVADLAPGLTEQLNAMTERAVQDVLESQQMKLQLGVEQLRAELNQEIDILQATAAGLKEEHSRLEHEIGKLSTRQSRMEAAMLQADQDRSTLAVDMACAQAELARVREWSEHAMRRSVNNVDELKMVVESLTDMFRKQSEVKDTIAASRRNSMDDQAASHAKLPNKPTCFSSGRKLRRSWAPAPLLDLEPLHASPVDGFVDVQGVAAAVCDGECIRTPPAIVVEPVFQSLKQLPLVPPKKPA